jgi:hemolysin D
VSGRHAGLEFAPDLLRLQVQAPSPMPRLVLRLLLALVGLMLAWAWFGQLDVVATAQGRIVPQSFLKIVQPAEPGIVREILVKDGDAVALGQTLIRMDQRLSRAERSVTQNELAMRGLQLRRIDAELLGIPFARQAGDDEVLWAQVQALHRARVQAQIDAVAGETALLAKSRQDLQVAQEIEAKLGQTAPLYREQAEGWGALAREGYAGRLMALERTRLQVENAQDMKAQAHNVMSLKASVEQSANKLAQIGSNYQQALHNERVEVQAQRHRLLQELDKQQHRGELLELKAPQAGTVKDLATHTVGTVVAPGAILLTLVPQDEPLLAEVWIGNADAGSVRLAQQVRLKLAAYPFQKHGMLHGQVRHISADAHRRPDEPGAAQSRPFQEGAYRALVALLPQQAHGPSGPLRLVPGMLVSAEIHLGTRSVLEYLLSPVQRLAQEAGRER